MSFAGFMWECKCGHVEYGEESPEECPKCYTLDSFTQLPEELIAERERDMTEDLDFASVRKTKVSKSISKTKTKAKEKKNESKKKKKVK